MADIDEDMFGTLRPSDDRQVDSSAKTDTEGGGGFRFLMYGPGGKQKRKPKEEKPFDPGAPVEVLLSSQAKEAAEAGAGDDDAVEVKLSAKATTPKPPAEPGKDAEATKGRDSDVPIKRINITL